jgi:mono/diheme cytochrome c family protein
VRAIVAVVVLLLAACGHPTHSQASADESASDAQGGTRVDRGRYLALAGDCAACHDGKDGRPYAGGSPIPTPFGTVLASNLTPDPGTGIGKWSDDEFVSAVQNGVRNDGKHLYPAMPYPYFTRMTRDDVLAIRSYLATLVPASNSVESNQLPFPFRIRALMAPWNALYFTPGVFQPNSGQSAEWNRGAYLVEGPGHCAACHTPKGLLGGDKKNATLAGGKQQGWVTPDLRRDERTGLATWSVDDTARYLAAGTNPHASATGPMAEVISKSTSKLSDADVHAIAAYLATLAGSHVGEPKPVAHDGAAWQAAEQLYIESCAACHVTTGVGVDRLIPPLKGSSIVQSTDPSTLVRVVLHGTQNVSTDLAPTAPSMPAFGWKLSDEEIASVLTYVRNAWGNAGSPVSPSVVQAARNARTDTP